MKVRDLSHFEMPNGKAWVYADELNFNFDASEFASGSKFITSMQPPGDDSVQCVVVVNCTSSELDAICEWDGAFNVWELIYIAHRARLDDFSEILASEANLAVAGVKEQSEWICFKLSLAEPGDRSSSDFNRGLLVASTGYQREKTSLQRMEEATQPLPIESQIIRAISSRLKPIKKFLPNKAVHLAYRTLELIR